VASNRSTWSTDPVEYTEIAYAVDDRIATVTLDRPAVLNAFTTTMQHELLDAFDRIDADDDVRVVIVTGRGRGFCAGADLSSGGSAFDATAARAGRGGHPRIPRDAGGRVALRIFDSLKPVIAAINGPAVGVGATMTLPMDIRLAAESARIGFVFARRGISPEACSSWFLPRIVGISQAAEWLYTGRVFDASEALSGGLVRSVHPDGELLDSARSLASEMATSTSAVSVALSRRLMWRMLGASHPMEAHRADSRAMFYVGQSADAYEGVTSFLEKRAPEFRDSVNQMPDVFPEWEQPEFR